MVSAAFLKDSNKLYISGGTKEYFTQNYYYVSISTYPGPNYAFSSESKTATLTINSKLLV